MNRLLPAILVVALKDRATAQALIDLVDSVGDRLRAHDTTAASGAIRRFLDHLDRTGCRAAVCPPDALLAPEAWALLQFNARYLAARLD